MAQQTGDLVPYASGSASLGVEQVGVCGMTTDIRPYCQIHQNSGVFHGQHGNSGVIRYRQDAESNDGLLEFSSDGGKSYRLGFGLNEPGPEPPSFYGNGPVIRADGHLQVVTSGVTFTAETASPTTGPTMEFNAIKGFQGLGGTMKFDAGGTVLFDAESSTYTVTDTFNASAGGDMTFAGGPRITFSSDHIIRFLPDAAFSVIADDLVHLSQDSLHIAANSYNASAGDSYTLSTSGFMAISADTFMTISSDKLMRLLSESQLLASSFSGSGILHYDFGPHRAWSVLEDGQELGGGPRGDGYWPIAHSGHVSSMIDTAIAAIEPDGSGLNSINWETGPDIMLGGNNGITIDTYTGTNEIRVNSVLLSGVLQAQITVNSRRDLQDAYEAGNIIVPTSADGDAEIWSSDTKGLTLVGTDGVPALSMSGVLQAGERDLGGLDVVVHSTSDIDQGIASIEEAQALSLGPASVALNTGSGIIPLASTSGCQAFRNVSNQDLNVFPVSTFVNINFNTPIHQPDAFFTWDSEGSGVKVMVPGLYEFNATIGCIGTGAGLKNFQGKYRVNGTTDLLGAGAGLLVINKFVNINMVRQLSLDAGDYVETLVSTDSTELSRILADQGSINCRYLGPRRGGLN